MESIAAVLRRVLQELQAEIRRLKLTITPKLSFQTRERMTLGPALSMKPKIVQKGGEIFG